MLFTGNCFHHSLYAVFEVAVTYHNNPKYWDRQALANSMEPNQMLQNVVSDQSLHCLPLI